MRRMSGFTAKFSVVDLESRHCCLFISSLPSVVKPLKMLQQPRIWGTFYLLMVNNERGAIVRKPYGEIYLERLSLVSKKSAICFCENVLGCVTVLFFFFPFLGSERDRMDSSGE